MTKMVTSAQSFSNPNSSPCYFSCETNDKLIFVSLNMLRHMMMLTIGGKLVTHMANNDRLAWWNWFI